MKKILTATLVAFAALIPTSHVFALDVGISPTTYTYGTDVLSNTCALGTQGQYYISDQTGTYYPVGSCGNLVDQTVASNQFNFSDDPNMEDEIANHNSFKFVMFSTSVPHQSPDDPDVQCTWPDDYESGGICAANLSLPYEQLQTITYLPPPPTGGEVFSNMIGEGDTAFQTVTGTNLAAGVGFVGDNFIKPWVGSGLALLLGLAGWLAALAAISAIVFFAFRALNNGLNERSSRRIVSGIKDKDKVTGTYDGKSKMIYDSRGKKFKRAVSKKAVQKESGYQAYKLRQALKKANYKDTKVHSAFGKNWT